MTTPSEIDWRAMSRKWENRAKATGREADELADELADWKAKAREHKNKAHTWRILYQDLLEKVATKLDVEHDPRTVDTNRKANK